MNLTIKKSVYNAIITHAQEELPIEACGYLAGDNEIITHYYPLKNMDNSSEHFSFDPEEQFKIVKEVREEGLEIIANYHSHPSTPARPSAEDIRLAYDPNIHYFIISLANKDPKINAFSFKNKIVKNIKIIIND